MVITPYLTQEVKSHIKTFLCHTFIKVMPRSFLLLKEPLKKLPEYALGLVKYSCSDTRLHGHCINPFPAELSLS